MTRSSASRSYTYWGISRDNYAHENIFVGCRARKIGYLTSGICTEHAIEQSPCCEVMRKWVQRLHMKAQIKIETMCVFLFLLHFVRNLIYIYSDVMVRERATTVPNDRQRNSWDCRIFLYIYNIFDRRMQMQCQQKPRSHHIPPYQIAAEKNVKCKHQTHCWIGVDSLKKIKSWKMICHENGN